MVCLLKYKVLYGLNLQDCGCLIPLISEETALRFSDSSVKGYCDALMSTTF